MLFVLDDCLMFRLAEGGSAERFGIDADITCLGKWIGGGLPVGAIAASRRADGPLRPARRQRRSTTAARSTATCSAASPGRSPSAT